MDGQMCPGIQSRVPIWVFCQTKKLYGVSEVDICYWREYGLQLKYHIEDELLGVQEPLQDYQELQ